MGDCGLVVHPWTGRNGCFMHADPRGFAMGGGGVNGCAAFAFWISEDFLHGTSAPSAPFGNQEPLASSHEFVIRRFECWAFRADDTEVPNAAADTSRVSAHGHRN